MLLRLAAPLQSWGERSIYETRDTARLPTRSGLLGMIASAMGRPRGASLDDLAPLTFTVRVDRPGVRVVDYHTAGGWLPRKTKIPTAAGSGRPEGKGTVQTWREYLSDAVFIVAVDGPDTLTKPVHAALRYPHWQPYLGRRSCPPSEPFLLGRVPDDAARELEHGVPLAPDKYRQRDGQQVEIIREARNRTSSTQAEIRDVPDVFSTIDRTYRTRWIETERISLPDKLNTTSRTYLTKLAGYIMGGDH
nr:type I-E CRISPR-associated protein Cas5/CasD [Haloechinothrix aidingensis]